MSHQLNGNRGVGVAGMGVASGGTLSDMLSSPSGLSLSGDL